MFKLVDGILSDEVAAIFDWQLNTFKGLLLSVSLIKSHL
jgi:hypothetical protein